MATALYLLLSADISRAVTNVFFSASQSTNLVATNATSDTMGSAGYLFTYTRDKLFTGGTGNPIGRPVRVTWPAGIEAQYVTSGPNPSKAQITVRRVDGAVFELSAFTAKLLANAGAGRSIEIVPLLNGQEPLNDPLFFDVSGNYGQEFSYDTSPNYLGTTAALTNYDAYVINLTLDYALTSLTVVDASLPPPALAISMLSLGLMQISWPVDALDYTLESATNLPATVWTAVSNNVVVNGDRCTVGLDAFGAQTVYRLRK